MKMMMTMTVALIGTAVMMSHFKVEATLAAREAQCSLLPACS